MAALIFAIAPPTPSPVYRIRAPNLRDVNPYARTWRRPSTVADGDELPPDYTRHHLDRTFREDVAELVQLGESAEDSSAVLEEEEDDNNNNNNNDDGDYYRNITHDHNQNHDLNHNHNVDNGNDIAAAADALPAAAVAATIAAAARQRAMSLAAAGCGPDAPFALERHDRLSLTMDKALIYPTDPPSVALYYLPQPLDRAEGDEIALELSVTPLVAADGTQAPPRAEPLYRVVKGPMWPWPHGPEYLIVPQREGCCVQRVARMTRSKTVLGSRWTIIFRGYMLDAGPDALEPSICEVQYMNQRWTHRRGALLAVEDHSDDLRLLVLQRAIFDDKPLQDLLVCAWVVRTWHKLSSVARKNAASARIAAMKERPAAETPAATSAPTRRWSLARRMTR